MPPKTASRYISEYFAKGLGKPRMIPLCRLGLFPTTPICPKRLGAIVAKELVAKNHFDASPINLMLLNYYDLDVVVSIRDLRQNIVSLAYHLMDLNIKSSHDLIAHFQYPIPMGFFLWSFSRQLDWHIETFGTLTVRWIKADNEKKIKVCFMTYEKFLLDRDVYVSEVLDFFDIPLSKFNFRTGLDKTNFSAYGFRKGKTDEWKSILSEKQLDRLDEIIPAYFYEKFDWEK